MINPITIIEKYYIPGSDLHYILTTHSRQVTEKALQIAEKHPELNIDKQFVCEAAMLHDIGIFLCEAPRIHCHGHRQYIEHGYLGADILRKEGLDQHALVCERHTGTGISLATIRHHQMPLPERDMFPVSIEEQLICYADKFYSKTQLHEEHTLERIRLQLSHFSEKGVRIFDEWHERFK